MTDTPGRLLSSLSNADGKPPKVGGCVGVFFQLFDWNRRLSGKHLFSTKSLPAERPPSNKFNDEKLPMAKLLLIADENRGVHSNSESQSEFGSEKSSDYGSSKKPGIVARLMGLESFPEAEVQSKEIFLKQQSQEKHRTMQQYQELQMLEDLLHKRPEDLRKIRREMESSPGNKVRVEEKMPKNARKDQDPMQKFAKLPLSPKKSGIPFASILSPSKSNKVTPPIKSQSNSRRTALLMGAAARILEPGIQPSRSRPLLENAPGASEDSKRSGGNRFYTDLKKSLPKTSKQAPQHKPREQQEVKKSSGLMRGPGSLLPGKSSSSSRSGSKVADRSTHSKSLSSKPQHRLEEVVVQPCEGQEERDDESLSDSQASSKENRNFVSSSAAKCQKVVAPPRLSRSGSVKEEQPPTPPSRGSLFRSKSVREEVQSSPQPLQPTSQQECSHSGDKNLVCSTSTPVSGGKEVRLKREKRQRSVSLQDPSSEGGVQKPRKPPLDQGRAAPVQRGNLHEQPQEQQKSKSSKQIRSPQEEKNGKSSSLLSYDRLFKTRKQPKSSSPKEGESNTTSKTNNINNNKSSADDKQSSKKLSSSSKDEESVKPQSNKSNDNSLMKSLLRRKPPNKAEMVSSSKKKAMECPKQQRSSRDHGQHVYERQTRSGGSSPARNLKETSKRDVVPSEVINRMHLQEESVELEEPVFNVSPEKVQAVERMHFEPDMIADKSLEEILKTILSKSLGKTSIGDSPLSGKKSSSLERTGESVPVANEDDGNVIDMELSPIESQSRFEIDPMEDLPCKVLQFEDDVKQTTTTPLALPPDAEANSKTTAEVDGGQPSPVSVLDFSALQSPFPSDVTTSREELDDDSKRVLESDAESIFTPGDHQDLVSSISDCKSNLDLESYSSVTSCFPGFPEVGVEEAASCEGQEIEFYVREVLLASGFTSEEVDETPSTVPCTEEIFQRLDRQLAIQHEQQGMVEFVSSSDSSQVRCLETPGSCHKLMHDCIAEALDLVLDPFRDDNRASSIIASSSSVISASSSSSSIAQRPLGEDLVAEVSSFILSWREMTLGMVDELVEVDMSTEAGKWRAFTGDCIEIGVDLERMIFRSVMEDLIADLVGSRLMSGVARKTIPGR